MMMRSRSLLSVIFCTHHCRGRFRWWSLAGTPQWQRSGANKFRRHMQMAPMLSNFAQRTVGAYDYEGLLGLQAKGGEGRKKIFLLNRSFAQQQP